MATEVRPGAHELPKKGVRPGPGGARRQAAVLGHVHTGGWEERIPSLMDCCAFCGFLGALWGVFIVWYVLRTLLKCVYPPIDFRDVIWQPKKTKGGRNGTTSS